MPSQVAGLNWMVESFVRSVSGVRQAVVVTADGLLLTAAGALDRQRADEFAAIASGLASMTVAAATHLQGGEVRHVLVETEGGLLLGMRLPDGSSLAVLADAGSDVGVLGYETGLLVTRIGAVLTSQVRREMRAALVD